MASLLCCGPKLAACGIVLSAWGVIMLVRGLPGDNRRGEGLRGSVSEGWKARRLQALKSSEQADTTERLIWSAPWKQGPCPPPALVRDAGKHRC